MFNGTRSRKFIAPTKTPAKQNPKSEYRNPKQIQNLNSNYEIRNRLVWNFLIFDHLKLFRISDFEFRICNLFILGVLCVFAGAVFFPIYIFV